MAEPALSFLSNCGFAEVSNSYRLWERRILFCSRPKSFSQPAGSGWNSGEVPGEEKRTMGRRSPLLPAAFLSRAGTVSLGFACTHCPFHFILQSGKQAKGWISPFQMPSRALVTASLAVESLWSSASISTKCCTCGWPQKCSSPAGAHQESPTAELTAKKVPSPAASLVLHSLETIFPC